MEIANQAQLTGKNSDIFMAVAVVSILGFMVIPLPPMLLDILLSFNITCALIIVLVATYILKPLELSSFPSIILLSTLFRLSLNIASTRIILLHGNEGTMAAGKVIKAFGSFVVGGNYVVGAIVFLILVIINFVVITKGSGRIAEVAARFTLDAMPGKQMSIDADLNAGLIDDQEAKARRLEISRVADFYGAMDGASKFVRGDAIAGVIITLINIIGGLAIGVLQNGMTFSHAARNYTLMTVGDGLVSQIPALIISTAAGIVVSRAGSESALGEQVSSQILHHPRAIGIAAAALFGFGLVPGLPMVPFAILAIIAGSVAYVASQAKEAGLEEKKTKELLKEKARPRERLEFLSPLDVVSLEVGYGLVPLVDVEQDGELLDRIKSIRRQIAQEIGIVIPPVHIQDNMQLRPGEYSILLKGNEVARGELMKNYYLAMNPGTAEKEIEGIPTKEPTYGLPAFWIKEEAKEKAIAEGYTVVDLATVLTTHLSDVIRRHGHELLGRQEVQKLLDNLKDSYPKVIEELVPNLLPLGGVVKVLQNLLREQIPIRDLLTILETLADWSPVTKDMDTLTEYVRQAMARTITSLYRTPEGNIPLITLDQGIEKAISGAIQQTEQGGFFALEPGLAQKIMETLARELGEFSSLNYQPIVLCSAQIRSHFKKLVDRFIPNLVVLSYNEILDNVKIQSLGTVELSDAD
ncbi:MAG: flagellar biosynthesis protein FlhA [Deltaproteobacteria bacterium]|nr:flagellar biosynthesis protein FlhA [Deltaproteobacteria bacterium]MBW1736393.1 flagellar biosynthesis protein FlhA [Deltaproteobacteria bacterium]MBW1908132.1 flagellar biosynthesis protein FlhA [Deltaproteobacteria bacterium]MBW2032211.1 flagellar biosynthesis protein FlhA [Deltaproteobacteria bacterium]MBW2113784.1 flagellar biosynthesis protein FlhA [Deltaproteobacteria bacterium]